MSTEPQPETGAILVVSGLVLFNTGGPIDIQLDCVGFDAVDWLFFVTGTGTILGVQLLGERDFGVFEATPIDVVEFSAGPIRVNLPFDFDTDIDVSGAGTRRMWIRGVPTAGPIMNLALFATGQLTIGAYAYRRVRTQGQITVP